MIVFRFFSGFFGSPTVTNSGGSITDIWPQDNRSVPLALFSAASFLGPVIAPTGGGFHLSVHIVEMEFLGGADPQWCLLRRHDGVSSRDIFPQAADGQKTMHAGLFPSQSTPSQGDAVHDADAALANALHRAHPVFAFPVYGSCLRYPVPGLHSLSGCLPGNTRLVRQYCRAFLFGDMRRHGHRHPYLAIRQSNPWHLRASPGRSSARGSPPAFDCHLLANPCQLVLVCLDGIATYPLDLRHRCRCALWVWPYPALPGDHVISDGLLRLVWGECVGG